jgi:hypothetical protein
MPDAANSISSLMNVYAPAADARILAVLVPPMETSLTELRYRELLAQRLLRLMQAWEAEAGAAETQRLLEQAAQNLELPPPYPHLPKVGQWQAWARFLAQESELIPQRLGRLGVRFPVRPEIDPEQALWLKGLFAAQDPQPNLAEWLGEAMHDPL